jgi:hypothetical protein
MVAAPETDASGAASAACGAAALTDQNDNTVSLKVPAASGLRRPIRAGKDRCRNQRRRIWAASGRRSAARAHDVPPQGVGGGTKALQGIGRFGLDLEGAACRVEHREDG